MKRISPHAGIGTLVNHYAELNDPQGAHIAPIYQTSAFRFPDVAVGKAIFSGEIDGYTYTRLSNPNSRQLARKIAALEGLDLLRERSDDEPDEIIACEIFNSGMAAISAGILARMRAGETVITQKSLYSGTFSIFKDLAPSLGIRVIWLEDTSPAGWERALSEHPQTSLIYAETPANPVMDIVDLAAVAEIARQHNAWLMVDNTFATPYCQRPLTLGADIVAHSTTKYLSGHGTVVGGALISPHVDFMRNEVHAMLHTLGGSPSPFDCWLTYLGLKTFELRMKRHCENAMEAARFLSAHDKVAQVFYPGLESHPGSTIARHQMAAFGGMIAFELKGGFSAGELLMNNLRMITLAVSLGNVDSLIQHPASMTHHIVPPNERAAVGVTDGLVRFSVGIENIDDILADLQHGLASIP